MWMRRLLKSFRRQEQGTDLGDAVWLRGSTTETAFLFPSQAEYFSMAVTALNAMGATRDGCEDDRDDRLVDKWKLPSGNVAYVGYSTSGAQLDSSQPAPAHNSLYAFPDASNPSYAGLVLAICFDMLHSLDSSNTPSIRERRNNVIIMMGVAGAGECGQALTQEAAHSTTMKLSAWLSQGDASPRLIETSKAAAETLRAHLKTGEDGQARVVLALATLAALCIADGEMPQKAWSFVEFFAGLMGVSKANYHKTVCELEAHLSR